MTYEEALALAYSQLPVFHRDGRSAIKPGLTNTLQFCEYLGNPQNRFKSIHIAGTNGKGSTSHMLAAIMQCAGYKVGLYTSPHLKHFTERIRVNGVEMDKYRVAEFIERHQQEFSRLGLSFFELTVGMAFTEFARQQVDIAIIETGIGGKLDSTNVIQPVLSMITNVSYDHMDVLGSTLTEIAAQKAGIIKPYTPVVLSQDDQVVLNVVMEVSSQLEAPVFVANNRFRIESYRMSNGLLHVNVQDHLAESETYILELMGTYQRYNLLGVLQTVDVLSTIGFTIRQPHIHQGLSSTITLTSLKGRWQRIGDKPLVFCDTGHNEAGIAAILECIDSMPYANLWIVLGCVRDKDVSSILKNLPKLAKYVFSQASSPRALAADELQIIARNFQLMGICIPDVNDALGYLRAQAGPNDLIVVCGSTYLVAEVSEI